MKAEGVFPVLNMDSNENDLSYVNQPPILETTGIHRFGATNANFHSSPLKFSQFISASDPDSSDLGVAVSFSEGNGNWYVSLDPEFSEDSRIEIPKSQSPIDEIYTFVSDDYYLLYIPDGENSEDASVKVRSWDQSSYSIEDQVILSNIHQENSLSQEYLSVRQSISDPNWGSGYSDTMFALTIPGNVTYEGHVLGPNSARIVEDATFYLDNLLVDYDYLSMSLDVPLQLNSDGSFEVKYSNPDGLTWALPEPFGYIEFDYKVYSNGNLIDTPNQKVMIRFETFINDNDTNENIDIVPGGGTNLELNNALYHAPNANGHVGRRLICR